MTYLIRNMKTDPYYNMAAEEYFLTRFEEEIILLWRNRRAVVIGQNQNALEEVDCDYVKEHEIAVVRRLSGGGAVFHDLGNVNYTVIRSFQDGLFSNYEYFTRPVCGYLNTLGVKAELSGRNDLLIEGMKFCGNAQTKRGNRIMHHGCILFSADVEDLSGALSPSRLKLESKGVKSVRSRVTNVASHLPKPMAPGEFFEGLYEYFRREGQGLTEYEITPEDEAEITRLAAKKYSTWEWNFGKSPGYTLQKAEKFSFGLVDVRLNVSRGLIQEIKIYGDFFGIKEISELEQLLRGKKHREGELSAALGEIVPDDYISGMKREELLGLLI